jgi:hypothetical protein
MKSAMAARPELNPQQVKEVLYGQATDMGDPGRDDVFGWGLLNASAICGHPSEPSASVID